MSNKNEQDLLYENHIQSCELGAVHVAYNCSIGYLSWPVLLSTRVFRQQLLGRSGIATASRIHLRYFFGLLQWAFANNQGSTLNNDGHSALRVLYHLYCYTGRKRFANC